MNKKQLATGFVILFLLIPLCVYPQNLAYKYLLELGKDSFYNGDYEGALYYFDLAQNLNPSAEEPLSYINLIKRLKEGRVEEVITPQREKVMRRTLDKFEEKDFLPSKEIKKKEKVIYRKIQRVERKAELKERERILQRTMDRLERKQIKEVKEPVLKEITVPERKIVILKRKKVEMAKISAVIVLTDKLRAKGPKVSAKIELGKDLIVEGKNVKRFLAVSPESLDAERIDKDKVRITAKNIGPTIFHLWDERGRWTFNIQIVFPREVVFTPKEKTVEDLAKPFKLFYSSDWNTYSRGSSWGGMERQSLTFDQRAGILGETPYGMFDSSATFTKFKKKTEVTSYTAGLTDGKAGPFRKFNLRGFDFYKRFSSLSFPGESLRGGSLEARAFSGRLKYDLFWGREKLTTGYLTPGVLGEKHAYLEGLRFTLSPYKDNRYSFNLARGYGSGRDDYLKENVFSFEAQNKLGGLRFSSELAFDQERFAGLLSSSLKKGNTDFRLSLRDIEKDFTTITSYPANRGEIGGKVGLSHRFGDSSVSGNLDIYRNRYIFNPDDPKRLNFDWDTSLNLRLTPSSSWRTYLTYSDNLGLLSPRRIFTLNNTYYKRIEFLKNKGFSYFLGNNYQRSRNPLSRSSDYDAFGLTAGFRLALLRDLYYYLNYDYTWVKEMLNGGKISPRAMTMGINYRKKISSKLSSDLNINYRDEEDTLGTYSFLAGEDSVEANLNLNFTPSPDWTVFVGARMRNIWSENPQREAYNEASIRWGVRSSWDTPFHWSPKAVISGFVFKDYNGNKKKDAGEDGISGVRVRVGKRKVKTDKTGRYHLKIRAKKVLVSVAGEDVPKGHVFTTPSAQEVEIVAHKRHIIDFGFTIQSGIYGVVFYDKNLNGKPDPGDTFIPQAKLVLDRKNTAFSDFGGEYFFRDITSGKHTLKIDLGSLPQEYLPLVKISNRIEVEEGTTYIFYVPLRKKSD